MTMVARKPAAIRANGARTVTSAVHGLLRHDSRTRQEFFALTTRGQ